MDVLETLVSKIFVKSHLF